MDVWGRCGICNGTGFIVYGDEHSWDEYNCDCHYGVVTPNDKRIWKFRDEEFGEQPMSLTLCWDCHGSGLYLPECGDDPCTTCNGAGTLPAEAKELTNGCHESLVR